MQLSMATIALGNNAKLDHGEIRTYLNATWSDLPPIGHTRAEGTEASDNTLAFRVGADDVIMGRMPAPIPWSDLEGPCATSWLWPEAKEVLQEHAEHIVVTVSSDSGPIERARLLTQVCAAICATCKEALGVIWFDSTVVMSSKMFIDFAVTIMPVYIWVDFRVGQNKDGTSYGFTTGLAALLLKDLETLSSPEPPGELRDRLFGLAGYLIDNGPVIKDGDTLGESAEERIKVTYEKGSFGQPFKVMRLHYGAQPAGGCLVYILLALGGLGLLTCCCIGPVGYIYWWK